MLQPYREHVNERAQMGLPPLPLTAEQVNALIPLLESPPKGEETFLVDLLTLRVPPGVDEAAKIKARFLADICHQRKNSPLIDKFKAAELLGTMIGGDNVLFLIELLEDASLSTIAIESLSKTLLVYDQFDVLAGKINTSPQAKQVLQNWAEATWFLQKPQLPESITLTVFKVDGEINTDDFSPASEAFSRPDIPLHALSFLASRMEAPLQTLTALKEKGHPLVFVGDVVGTGSSRKSATNSLIYHIGEDIPFVPNKKKGGVVLGGKIAPIFFNTLEDAGALPIECDVSAMRHGDVLHLFPAQGKIINATTQEQLTTFTLSSEVILDEVRAGGRIPLIIGRNLTARARKVLDLPPADFFKQPALPAASSNGYTLAQKMIGKACGLEGVRPGTYCEPLISTVGSQDTTGPMTRDELKELACPDFQADLVMQSFCHTAAYPKPTDIKMQTTLPAFMTERSGIALKPGDGVIHPFLNRMILPDQVGTGGDSHTRFPLGISFPAGSGMVAFAAAMGNMPLQMPESVRVRFSGQRPNHLTVRDLVNAIAYAAIQKGLLTTAKANKVNAFSGRILEMEGLTDLTVEEAFELTDASAERSAAASTIRLDRDSVVSFLSSNKVFLKWLISNGYQDAATLARRIEAMDAWLDAPSLLTPDDDAVYAATLDIHLDDLTEPLLACPNDPDDVKRLSDVAGTPIDEIFIGSCMTHIGHFRTAAMLLKDQKDLPTRLWLAPPTRMDADQLKNEGLYSIFATAGARLEIPGCSLCMGNQARTRAKSTVVSTSTRNFPNRMGDQTDVYLASAEVATLCAILGRIPTPAEYLSAMEKLTDAEQKNLNRPLRFQNLTDYQMDE